MTPDVSALRAVSDALGLYEQRMRETNDRFVREVVARMPKRPADAPQWRGVMEAYGPRANAILDAAWLESSGVRSKL